MSRSPEADRQWKLAGRFSAVGIEMAAAVAIGALGGRWLDGKLGTDPYLMWFGLAVGIGAAVRAVLRVVKAYRRL
jgi:F0F1-type ATP synthase assembly protein I